MSIVCGIILIILGLFLILKPTVTWKIQSSLFVKDGEPTRLYFIVARVTGAAAAAVGILVMIFA